jgi:hypothetical protein
MDFQYIPPGFQDASECQNCQERADMDQSFLNLAAQINLWRQTWLSWVLKNACDLVLFHKELQTLLKELEQFAQRFATAVEVSRVADAVVFDQYYIAIQFGMGNALTTGVVAHSQYWEQTRIEMEACRDCYVQLQAAWHALHDRCAQIATTSLPDLQALETEWTSVQSRAAIFRGGLQGWIDQRQRDVFSLELPE